MDAQTRHALKQNEFGEMLGSLRDSVGSPGFRKWLLIGVLLVVVVVAWQVWRAGRSRSTQAAWTELLITLRSSNEDEAIESLRRRTQQNAAGPVGAAARLMLAHLLMENGLEDSAKTQANTAEAAGLLRAVVDDGNISDAYRSAARFKLATAHETLGSFDEARKQYEVLVQDARFAGSPYRPQAAERLTTLDAVAAVGAFTPGNAPVASQPAFPPVNTMIETPLGPSLPSDSEGPPEAVPEMPVPAEQPSEQPLPADTSDTIPATQPASP